MKLKVAIFFFLSNLLNTAAMAEENVYEDVSNLIDAWLEGQKDFEDIPSIVGMVVKDQQILWSGAFGESNQATAQAMTVNTLTSVCSVSKVFTATATMKLVDDGQLELDAPISKLLPRLSLKQVFPEGGEITVRSLLTHSSGVPRDTNHNYWGAPDHHFPTESELYEFLSESQTIHAVDSSVAYSNVGYALLGQVIEHASGKTYKDYVEEELFEPIGMKDSVVELPKSLIGSEHAVGYTARNRDGTRKQANMYQAHSMQSAVGISTTVMDLARFAMWQFRVAGANDSEVLDASSLLSMYDTQAENSRGADRGLGYQVSVDSDGNRWVEHGGICPGYVSYLKMDVSNKIAYAIMINANQVRALAYVNGLIEIINRAESDGLLANTPARPDLTEYTGFYDVNPWNSEYYVGQWGQDLMLLYFPAESLQYALYQYRRLEGDVFQLVEDGRVTDSQIEFIRDQSGEVVSVKDGGQYHGRIRTL